LTTPTSSRPQTALYKNSLLTIQSRSHAPHGIEEKRQANIKNPIFPQLLPFVLSLSKDEWMKLLPTLPSVHGSTSSPQTGDILQVLI
jgi:hypothetical protein